MTTQTPATIENPPVVVSEVQTKLVELRNTAKETNITDEKSLDFVVESGSIAARLLKVLEEERKKLVDPINKKVNGINAFFKEFSVPLEDVKDALGKKVTEWKREQERKAEEERKRAQAILDEQRRKELEDAKKSGVAAPAVALEVAVEQVANTVQSSTGSATGRKRWTYEVLDESQVPREYLSLDSKNVNEAIRKGTRAVPGLRIFEAETAVFK